MTERFPVDQLARTRLREAQRSEADALKAVTLAVSAYQAATARSDQARRQVDAALAELVKVSGVARAARLTGEPVNALRRAARNTSPASGDIE